MGGRGVSCRRDVHQSSTLVESSLSSIQSVLKLRVRYQTWLEHHGHWHQLSIVCQVIKDLNEILHLFQTNVPETSGPIWKYMGPPWFRSFSSNHFCPSTMLVWIPLRVSNDLVLGSYTDDLRKIGDSTRCTLPRLKKYCLEENLWSFSTINSWNVTIHPKLLVPR